jgi:hypothetical protein
MNQYDIYPQLAAADQLVDGTNVAGNDICQSRDTPTGPGAIERSKFEVRCEFGTKGGGLRQAEQEHGGVQITALINQHLCQGKRLSGPLRPSNNVMRVQQVFKIQLQKLELF